MEPIPESSAEHVAKEGVESRNAGQLATPLNECRDVSVARLKEVFSKALDRLRPELLRIIDMALGLDAYYLYMAALELVRDHQKEIEAAFSRSYQRRFNQACREESHPTGRSVDSDKLSLLAPDDLEESLAVDVLANAIRDNCVEELFSLDKRMGMLINDPDLVQYSNPLGPDVIARAVMDAFEEFDAEIKPRLLLMTQLSKPLPDEIRDIYRDINQLLVRRNVLPTIRVGVRRSGQPAHSSASASAPQYEGEMAPGGGESGVDLFAMFQRMVNMGGAYPAADAASGQMGGTVPAGMANSGGMAVSHLPPLQTGTILQSLNQLQRGRTEGLDWSGLSADALGNDQYNMLHGLRTGGMSRANPIDTMTLDIVAMVFDYIFDDSRIPPAMKALIGRLQIPVLKVGMLDKSFFSKKGHHVRRFLDALAAASISLPPENIQESAFYRKAEELVGRILDQFDDRVEIFSEALTELNDFLEQERHKTQPVVASGIEAIRLKEAEELSRHAARDVVRESLTGHPVPIGIRDFILRYWQRLLTEIHLQSGSEGSAWNIAVSTMANLIWSVEPKYDSMERSNLTALIPSLLMELRMGADRLNMPQDDRELFFATLAPCHTLALKSIVLEDEATVQPVMVEEPVPPADESHDFQPLPIDIRKPLKHAASKSSLPASAESSIDGLALGCWIEHVREDGVTQVTQLTWISPLKGLYMFTDHEGQSALSITPRGLKAKLRTGEVRILNDDPLMDRVVGNLMDRFQQQVA